MRWGQLGEGLFIIMVGVIVTMGLASFFLHSPSDLNLQTALGEHVILECRIVTAFRSQLKHLITSCQGEGNINQNKEFCEKEVLQVEVEYEDINGVSKHFTTHFDIPQEKLYLCETVQSCLHQFGLKYGENDCYYHGSKNGAEENYNNNDALVHNEDGEEGGHESEIYLKPDHPHDLWPLVYFFIALLVCCVPCCCVLGTIITLASPFDMDVDIETFNLIKSKVNTVLPITHSDNVSYKLK